MSDQGSLHLAIESEKAIARQADRGAAHMHAEASFLEVGRDQFQAA